MDSERGSMELDQQNSPVEIKKEPVENEDIKDYAANTMNELLAIYGYDEKVDKSVTEDLQLQNFSEDKKGKPKAAALLRKIKPAPLNTKSDPDPPPLSDVKTDNGASGSNTSEGATTSGNDLEVAQVSRPELVTAIRYTANLDDKASPKGQHIVCAWCQQTGIKNYTLNTATESKAFCSEKCFASCRRAYFKRNKVCDWCRHIRHTKEYVEFQSRDTKLQFCSVKCLNQYKMDVFCKETNSLGTSREYNMDVLGGSDLPSFAADRSVTVVSPVTTSTTTTTTKKGKKTTSTKRDANDDASSTPNMVDSSAEVANTPLSLTTKTKASNGTVRSQIQTMLHNRGQAAALRVQAQADSTVPNNGGAVPIIQTVAASRAPQAAINAAASVQAAAALQQSTFLGMPALFQSPLPATATSPGPGVVGHGPGVVGQVPIVVGSNQIPIIQQGNIVVQQNQPIGANTSPRIVPPPSTSPSVDDNLNPPHIAIQPDTANKANTQPLPTAPTPPSSVLPPLTIIVPHPIFIPIPIPIPVPIPIRADVFDETQRKMSETKSQSQESASPKKVDDSSANSGVRKSASTTQARDLDEGRSQSLMNLSAAAATDDSQEDDSRSHILHDRVRILKGLQKTCGGLPSSSYNSLLTPFHASNGLHRSASLDLSLASQQNIARSSLERLARPSQNNRKVKTRLVLVGEEPSRGIDEGRESSRKVREALRCHLNKRLSQSALNLSAVGVVPSEVSALRRSCSMSLLRDSSTVHPVNTLGSSSSHHRGHHYHSRAMNDKTRKAPPKRILDSCNKIDEDIETERELMIHEEDPEESDYRMREESEPEDEDDLHDDDEPNRKKRKKWTNDS